MNQKLSLKSLNERINSLENEQNRAYIYHPDKMGAIERITLCEKRAHQLLNNTQEVIVRQRETLRQLTLGLREMERFRHDFIVGKFTLRYKIKQLFKNLFTTVVK